MSKNNPFGDEDTSALLNAVRWAGRGGVLPLLTLALLTT